MDGSVFAFFAFVCLATGVVFGLAPALHVSKTNVNEVLKEGGRSGSTGIRARRWTGALIVVNLALTLVLLAGAGFMMRSFMAMYRLDLGIDTSRLLTMQMALPIAEVPQRRRAQRVHQAGRGAAGRNRRARGGDRRQQLAARRRPRHSARRSTASPDRTRLPIVTMLSVGPKYFDTIGSPMRPRPRVRRRRTATPGTGQCDRQPALRADVLPERGSDRPPHPLTDELPNPNGPPLPPFTIVGVSPTIRQRNRQNQQDPEPDRGGLHPQRRATRSRAPIRRCSCARARDPAQATPLLREEVRALDPDLPLFNIRTMDQNLAQQRWPFRVFGTMFAVFALHRARPVGGRPLRHHRLLGDAAHAGNRRAHGARRRRPGRCGG